MILTCPACATQYVVKDGAIPAGGRKVRCAACKHSWQQDPDPVAEPDDDVMASVSADADSQSHDPGETAASDESALPIEEFQQEPVPADGGNTLQAGSTLTGYYGADYGLTAPSLPASEPLPTAESEEWQQPDSQPAMDDDFDIPAMEEDEPRSGRGPRMLLLLLLLVALAAASFWFLAPSSLKARVGLAQGGATPLEVMLTTSDRQKLASGNELLAISGRVINPTDREVRVPPIRASLRNKASRQTVYEWTIAPPARSLPPRGSAVFNSAEVDIPEGGDELTVSLGDQAS